MRADSRLVATSCVVSTPVWTPNRSARVFSAMTTSSSAQLPARSPMPLMAPSTWRAPACDRRQRVGDRHAEIVVAMGREHAHRDARRTWLCDEAEQIADLVRGGIADGVGHVQRAWRPHRPRPPAHRQGNRARCGSRPRPRTRRRRTIGARVRRRNRTAAFSTSSRLIFSLAARWIGLVPRKMWMRCFAAGAQRAGSGVDVGLVGARERAEDRALDFAATAAHAVFVARRGGGEAGLDHVDAQRRQRLGHLQLVAARPWKSRAPARRRAASCRRRVTRLSSVAVYARSGTHDTLLDGEAVGVRLAMRRTPKSRSIWRPSTSVQRAVVAAAHAQAQFARRRRSSASVMRVDVEAAPLDEADEALQRAFGAVDVEMQNGVGHCRSLRPSFRALLLPGGTSGQTFSLGSMTTCARQGPGAASRRSMPARHFLAPANSEGVDAERLRDSDEVRIVGEIDLAE